MRVIVPHVAGMLRPDTVRALGGAAYPLAYADLSGCGDSGYARLVRAVWDQGIDTVIVEQDIIVGPGTLDGFQACPADWCYHAYPVASDYDGPMLGCTRFRGALMRRWPAAGHNGTYTGKSRNGLAHWSAVDQGLWSHLHALGERPHRHLPDVGHLHVYT